MRRAVLFLFMFLGTGGGLPLAAEGGNVYEVSIVPDAAWRCGEAFSPSVLTVPAGSTVEWINLDRETHTLVSSEGSQPCYMKALPPEDRLIDGGQLPRSKRYRKRFDEPGEYVYACHLPSHHMAGKIIVTP